ncbi:DUF4190 domain-containing protein [Nocardia seriolae]|uniref:DUF4190 domain-containing protein n=1 Tax=Nocardia seriolae TaxID=37332 RepID=UPI001D15F1A9|nr:DUF4190 domain-containing protein [Nocardia seriolae]WNJ58982.1 DUF4190 domain-containing protein [Nocardia seriolae]
MTYDPPPPGWDPQFPGFDKQPQDQQPQGGQPLSYGYVQQPGYYPGYPQPAPGYYPQPYYGAPPPDHPQAVVVLILGIMSLVFCPLLGPVAWIMGGSARRELTRSQGAIGGSGMVTAGWICGIIASAGMILLLLFIVFAVIAGSGGSPS